MKENPKIIKCKTCQDKKVIVYGTETETGSYTIPCPNCKNKKPETGS